MIRLQYCIIIILLLNILCTCVKKTESCCVEITKPLDAYIYPERIGNSDWNVYQIPDTILLKLSTPALIQSLLDNPNLPLMNIYSNVFQGRDFVLKKLNASYELNKRADACQQLFDRYKQMAPCCLPQKGTSLERGAYVESWASYEKILTQDSIINQFTHNKKVSFANELIKKDEFKAMYGDSFGTSRTTGILVLSQIMKLENYLPFINELNTNSELKLYTDSGLATNYDLMRNIVLEFAKKFIQT